MPLRQRKVLLCPVCGNTARHVGVGHIAICEKGHKPTPMVKATVRKGLARR